MLQWNVFQLNLIAYSGNYKKLKVFYHAEIVFRILDCMNAVKSYKATILDAMKIADKAWRSVP